MVMQIRCCFQLFIPQIDLMEVIHLIAITIVAVAVGFHITITTIVGTGEWRDRGG